MTRAPLEQVPTSTSVSIAPGRAGKSDACLHLRHVSKHVLGSTDRHPVVLLASALQTNPHQHVRDYALLSNVWDHHNTTTIAHQAACQPLVLHHVAFERCLHVHGWLWDVHPILGQVNGALGASPVGCICRLWFQRLAVHRMQTRLEISLRPRAPGQ